MPRAWDRHRRRLCGDRAVGPGCAVRWNRPGLLPGHRGLKSARPTAGHRGLKSRLTRTKSASADCGMVLGPVGRRL